MELGKEKVGICNAEQPFVCTYLDGELRFQYLPLLTGYIDRYTQSHKLVIGGINSHQLSEFICAGCRFRARPSLFFFFTPLVLFKMLLCRRARYSFSLMFFWSGLSRFLFYSNNLLSNSRRTVER